MPAALDTDTDPWQLLITASHILSHHSVLDAFGHISIRNPSDPSTYFQSSKPAALLASPDDFTLYRVSDGLPVEVFPPAELSPYSEHYIHAAIFARFSQVNSVIHSHARDILPFGVRGRPRLQPLIHVAGFIPQQGAPVWDIAQTYRDSHVDHHLLVNNYPLAESLAAMAIRQPGGQDFHSVVLQRGHGFVVLGKSVQDAVFKAIYTVENAKVQSQALHMGEGHVRYLTPGEAQDCTKMLESAPRKTWPVWTKEVEHLRRSH